MKRVTIGKLNASFENVKLDIGLVISEFSISSNSSSAKIDPFELELPTPGEMKAIVTERAIADFLEHKAPGGLKEVDIKAHEGKIHLTGKITLVVNINVDATATLEIVNGKELHVKLLALDALGGKATTIVESQLAQINPILDVKDIPLDVMFTRVVIEDGLVTVFGQVTG